MVAVLAQETHTLTTIEKLLVLQDRDRRIKQALKDTEDIPARKKLNESTLNEHKAALQAAQDQLKNNSVAIKGVELEIETQRQRIGKLRVQQNTVRSNDEYRAIEREIAGVEKQIRDEEDKEIVLMEEAEGLRANAALMEQRLKQEEKVVQADAQGLDQRLSGIREDIDRLKAERATLAQDIDVDWLARYDRIFKHTGDFALVPVEFGSCGGCHMKLPPQLTQDAKRNETMTTCSFCGRLLYWRA